MYVELYILDNWLMNVLILRLAACLMGLRSVFWRDLLFALLGALYALCSLFYPWLLHPVMKVVLCFIMAFSAKWQGVRAYLLHVGAVALSTFIAGGTAYALALLTGGDLSGGYIVASLPLRAIIYTAVLIAFLPNLLRRIRRERITSELQLPIVIEQDGNTFSLTGIVDTGSSLSEPVSALPGLLVCCNDLKKYANTPVITHGAFQCSVIYGFMPDRICISGQEVAAFIFLTESDLMFSGAVFQALIPPDALPIEYKNKYKSERKVLDSEE